MKLLFEETEFIHPYSVGDEIYLVFPEFGNGRKQYLSFPYNIESTGFSFDGEVAAFIYVEGERIDLTSDSRRFSFPEGYITKLLDNTYGMWFSSQELAKQKKLELNLKL